MANVKMMLGLGYEHLTDTKDIKKHEALAQQGVRLGEIAFSTKRECAELGEKFDPAREKREMISSLVFEMRLRVRL